MKEGHYDNATLITTMSYSFIAHDTGNHRDSNPSVHLIDGFGLVNLMVEHSVGIVDGESGPEIDEVYLAALESDECPDCHEMEPQGTTTG